MIAASMSKTMLSAPAAEPVSLDEAKAWLRIDGNEEDNLVSSLIEAARQMVERQTGLLLISQSWRLGMDKWPSGWPLALPLRPLLAVSAIRVYDHDDQPELIDPASYVLDGASDPARLIWRDDHPRPSPGRSCNGIEIDVEAGFGPDPANVPRPLRQAILLLVAHWFENRQPLAPHDLAGRGEGREAPHMVRELLAPWRRVSL